MADGSDVEIMNWLDDHSRLLLACTAHPLVTGALVISSFLSIAAAYGLPAATLTDNGSVYTSRFTGDRNGFEYLLAELGVTQRNGHAGHPQTQGKIERFHKTLKRWLAAQPPAAALAALQRQLDQFRTSTTPNASTVPTTAHRPTPTQPPSKPTRRPARTHVGPYRLRVDVIDRHGKISLRRAGRMHHLGIGAAHADTSALVLVHPDTVEVINPASTSAATPSTPPATTGATHNNPGHWPGSH